MPVQCKLSSEPMLISSKLDHREHILVKSYLKNFAWSLTNGAAFKKRRLKMSAKCQPFCLIIIVLIHLPLVPHICVSELGQRWFRYWLVAYSALSHYLNQFWVVVNGALEQSSVKFWSKYKTFHIRKCIWKYRLRNGGHFVQGEMS